MEIDRRSVSIGSWDTGCSSAVHINITLQYWHYHGSFNIELIML